MSRGLSSFYGVLGALMLLYFVALGVGIRFGLSVSWVWALWGVMLLLAAAVGRLPLPGWLRVCWRVFLVAAAGALCVSLGFVVSGMRAAPPGPVDAVVVLGARVDRTGPSLALQHRIDTAAEYLKAHPEVLCVASGGMGTDEQMSEAACIAQELERQGIEPERIILEDQSRDTYENIRNSKALLPEDVRSVALITNNYHVYRAVRLAKKGQLAEEVYGLAAPFGRISLPHFMVRDALALITEHLRGTL